MSDSSLSFCPVSPTAPKSSLIPYPPVTEEASEDGILTFCLSCLHSIHVAMTTVSQDSSCLLSSPFAQKPTTALLPHQVSSTSSGSLSIALLTWPATPRSPARPSLLISRVNSLSLSHHGSHVPTSVWGDSCC